MKKTIEELLQTPYWIIDILPYQVPADSAGQYFAIAEYFLKKKRLRQIKQKHINVIFKLNCYKDITIDENTARGPSPKEIAKEMRKRYLYVCVGESMILSEPDDTHMTFFNPDPETLELVKMLAASEGLFVWKP